MTHLCTVVGDFHFLWYTKAVFLISLCESQKETKILSVIQKLAVDKLAKYKGWVATVARLSKNDF